MQVKIDFGEATSNHKLLRNKIGDVHCYYIYVPFMIYIIYHIISFA